MRDSKKLGVLAGIVVVALTLSCRNLTRSPYSPDGASLRNTIEAQRLSREAADLIDQQPTRAEQLLRAALAEDLFYGPAHNNLGVLFLSQDNLYDAANEFEWARKLMPGHPDPRTNLALTLERAGQMDEAIESYEAALEVYPGHIAATQGLTRLCINAGIEHEDLEDMLNLIALRGESPAWRDWARKAALKRSGS